MQYANPRDLFYNWKFIPLIPFTPFSPLLILQYPFFSDGGVRAGFKMAPLGHLWKKDPTAVCFLD